MNLITENMYLPTISYLDIIRTNNLVNICWGKVVFYRCSVIVLLPWNEQGAFKDDSRQRDEEWRHMDAHAGEWKRTQHMDTNCNAVQ